MVTLKHDLKKCYVAAVPSLNLPVKRFHTGESFRGNIGLTYRQNEVAMVARNSILAVDPTLPVTKMEWVSLEDNLKCTNPNIKEPPNNR